MSYTDLLIDSCTTQRFTEGAADDYGIPVKTWADYLTEDCRLQATTATEVMVGAEVVVANYKLFLGDVDITEQDHVIISSITYEVLFVKDLQDGVGDHHKECLMRTAR